MTVESIVFYLFAALTVLGAVGVITVRNAVQAVLCLVLTFFSAAVLWMLLEAEFLAVTLVLVYVGAVMVLFLFVVMMLDVDYASLKSGFTRYLPLGILVALALFGAIYWVIRSEVLGEMPEPAKHSAEYSNVTVLGKLLYTEYFYAFEVAGVILPDFQGATRSSRTKCSCAASSQPRRTFACGEYGVWAKTRRAFTQRN